MAMDGDGLQFCWNDSKAASNEDKHGVSFKLATFVFDDLMWFEEVDVFSEREYRSIEQSPFHA